MLHGLHRIDLILTLTKKDNLTFSFRRIEDATTYLGNDSLALPYLTPETNVTCFVDTALNNNNTTDMFSDEAFEAIASDCALPTLPFVPKDLDDAFTVLVIAVLGCGQQYCLIAALRSEAPSKVTMVRSLSIIFSFMFEAVASAVDPATKMPRIESWLGAAVVFVAIMIVASSELRDRITRAGERLFCFKASPAASAVQVTKEKPVETKRTDEGGNTKTGDEERGEADNGDPKKEKEEVARS